MHAILISTKLSGEKLVGEFASQTSAEKFLFDNGFEYEECFGSWLFEHYMAKVLEITTSLESLTGESLAKLFNG